jgi:serralysin
MSENSERFCICISDLKQGNTKAALLSETKWQSGDVIKIKFLEGDESLQQRVRETAEAWTGPDMADLKFEWVDEGDADIRIAFEQGNGSWSYLGTVCRQIPDTEPTMNYGWLTPDSPDDEVNRVVKHEFGHALGLIHEHQNPKGGIEWNEPAVIADLSGPPNNWDEEQIRHNVLDHYAADAVEATDVDGDSIMMYPIPKSWTLDGFSADLNTDLSEQDVEFIRGAYQGAYDQSER